MTEAVQLTESMQLAETVRMDEAEGTEEHENPYAGQFLFSIQNHRNRYAGAVIVRLLYHISRILQEHLEETGNWNGMKTERKLKRKIDEKKQAHGLKQG